jgi:hypothetical protein
VLLLRLLPCCCRFIAGYAKVVDVCLFWGAVAALLLVYWEVRDNPTAINQQSDCNRSAINQYGCHLWPIHACIVL